MDPLNKNSSSSILVSNEPSPDKNYDEVRKRAAQVMTRLQQSKNNLLPTLYEIDHRSITHIMAKITHFTESADNLIEQLEFLEKRIETQIGNIDVLMNSLGNSEDVIEKLFQLPADIALNLCHEILDLKIGGEKCSHLITKIAIKKFRCLKLGQFTQNQCFALYEKLIEKGDEVSIFTLVNYLCQTGLMEATVEQRLKLFKALIIRGAACELVAHFKKLGLEDATSKERLELCMEIAEQGDKAVGSLMWFFETLGLGIEHRLELCAKIAEKGDIGVQAVIDNFDKLSLENATLDQRLKLCAKMVQYGGVAVVHLIDIFDKFDLGSTMLEQRLELCAKIAEQGELAVISLIDNFEKFGLGNSTPEQRINLCKKMVEHGEVAVLDLVDNLQKFDLGKATPDARLKLYKWIANQGPYGLTGVLNGFLNGFNRLELENSAQRLELAKEFLNRGNEVSELLAQNFHKIVFDKNDLFSFFGYVCVKGLQKQFFKQNVFDSIGNKSIKRQVLIDLLCPPSGLRGVIDDVTKFGSFEHENFINDPIITLLNKKPGQLSGEICGLDIFIDVQPKLKFLNSFIAKIETEKEATIQKNIQKESQKLVKKSEETIRREAEFVKQEQIIWVAYAAAILYDLDDDLVTSFVQTKVLDLINSYSHPSLRYTLMRAFSLLSPVEVTAFYKAVTCPKSIFKKQTQLPEEELEKVSIEKVGRSLTQLQKPAFLLAPLTNFGLSPKKSLALNEQILGTRSMKQIAISSALAQLLSVIALNGPYKTEEADKIADCIIKALKQPEIFTKLKKKDLEAAKEGEEKVNQEVHQQRKEEQTKKDLVALMNILQIFGKSELIRFVNPEHESLSAVAFFQISFKKLFSVQEFPDFEKQYQKTFGQFRDPMALFSYYRSVDRLPNDEKTAVMKALNVYVNSVLREDFQAVRSNPANSAHLQHIFTARPELQTRWCESLGSKNVAGGEAEVKENEEQSSTRLQVVETVDPCDLLMIGTELKNSCQTIYGDPLKNRGLVSYLMNGEIRAFAVKQGDKLVARVLLRLMWDDTNQCPILLQERLYSNVDDPAVAQAINDLVKEKAKVMGLNVVTKGVEGEGVPYQGTVKFLGGFAPVGYCDSGEGLVIHKEEHDKTVAEGLPKPPANAPFNVVGTCHLYSPQAKGDG